MVEIQIGRGDDMCCVCMWCVYGVMRCVCGVVYCVVYIRNVLYGVQICYYALCMWCVCSLEYMQCYVCCVYIYICVYMYIYDVYIVLYKKNSYQKCAKRQSKNRGYNGNDIFGDHVLEKNSP